MVRPLGYDAELSLEEAYQRYREVKAEFDTVKSHYRGVSYWIKQKTGTLEIKDADQGTLVDCIGVLLPLSLNPVVQQEIRENRTLEGTLHAQSGMLLMDISAYMAQFNNTGVTVLKGDMGL